MTRLILGKYDGWTSIRFPKKNKDKINNLVNKI